MKKTIRIALAAAILTSSWSCQTQPTANQAETVLAIGSCSNQVLEQPLWPQIAKNQPELFIWLGDVVYPEAEKDPAKIKEMYRQQKENSGYQLLTASAKATGIWDDHDFGLNDGGKNNPIKEQVETIFLDFLEVPANAPVRQHRGIYRSEDYFFQDSSLHIKLLLLDVRYFRDDLQPATDGVNRYQPNPDGTILGEAQWKWLENELLASEAHLNLICSGIQVLSDQHPFEKWANFPNERERLLSIIAQSGAKGIMLLSGDRHVAELASTTLPNMPYSLWEFTSSGLTHFGTSSNENNPYLLKRINALNFGVLRIAKEENGSDEKWKVTMEVRGEGNEELARQEVVY